MRGPQDTPLRYQGVRLRVTATPDSLSYRSCALVQDCLPGEAAMSTDPTAPAVDLSSKPLPYPKTERQAEFMALAERLAASAGARAAEHDRTGTFPVESIDGLRASGYAALTVP